MSLSGIVELDDAYFGAPSSNGKQGSGADKTSALAAVSLTGEGHPLFLKMQVSKLGAESVCAVARQTVRSGSEIHSDALRPFRFNCHFWSLQLFSCLVRAVATSNILGYGDLTR